MSTDERNLTDDELDKIADHLDEGERTLLVAAGALPKEVGENLTTADVVRLIEIAKES